MYWWLEINLNSKILLSAISLVSHSRLDRFLHISTIMFKDTSSSKLIVLMCKNLSSILLNTEPKIIYGQPKFHVERWDRCVNVMYSQWGRIFTKVAFHLQYMYSHVSFIPYFPFFGFWYFGYFSCVIFFCFSILPILPCKM